MSLLLQLIRFLSQPPGNIVYHLVTLFALQAILGMTLRQWRHDRHERSAWRMSVAAGCIFLAHLGLLVVGLSGQNNTAVAVTYLPPLSQAMHTITAVFLIWALAPLNDHQPRLSLTFLVAMLILIGVMSISFIQNWQSQATSGQPYNSTLQATIWGIFQISILLVGFFVSLIRRSLRATLRPFILGIFVLAYVAHFWNYPELVPTDNDVAYWIRLGYLLAFPLWAVLIYQQTTTSPSSQRTGMTDATAIRPLPTTLPLFQQLITSLELDNTLQAAIELLGELTQARFVGIALAPANAPNQLRLTSNLPQIEQNQPRSWNLNLDNWPAFRLAREQSDYVELRANGLGARQLHLLYTELGLHLFGTMLIHPLLVKEQWLGLLLLARTQDQPEWSEPEKETLIELTHYIAQAIYNSQQFTAVTAQISQTPAFPPTTQADSGRIITLEDESRRLLSELETAQSRARQAEARAAEARKEATDLGAALTTLQEGRRDGHQTELEMEIATLRESLRDAEEAMALAAAGESELSTEWVMLAITRYSSQLEEAQARIELLEIELRQQDARQERELLTALAQELRTPMTSIAGYTDLLLGETIGILGAKQREFLQRVKSNTERMGTLLDQIIQLATQTKETEEPTRHTSSFADVLDTAVHAVITQIREKHLHLDLNIPATLPFLPVKSEALRQMMVHLLDNACRASDTNGRVRITAQAKAIAAGESGNGHAEQINFIHITVQDSGCGIHPADRPHVFDPYYQTTRALIPGVGDTGAGLALARSLAVAHGGRLWVDSEPGGGATFSLLFPLLPAPEGEATAPETAAPIQA